MSPFDFQADIAESEKTWRPLTAIVQFGKLPESCENRRGCATIEAESGS